MPTINDFHKAENLGLIHFVAVYVSIFCVVDLHADPFNDYTRSTSDLLTYKDGRS